MAKMSAVARAAGSGLDMADNDHMSVSCRQISNGYIVSHSRSTDKGYEHTETYHEKKPDIEAALRKVARGKVRST